jgi:integrase
VATGRITKRTVEAVETPPAATRAYLWDDKLKGFGVMVTPAGTRCYLVQYKLGGRAGKTRRFSIGHHGNPWTTDAARDRGAELLEMVRRGVDPMDAERDSVAQAAERKKVDTELGFSTFADVFLQKHVDDRAMRSAADIHGVFRRDLKPWFQNKPIHRIDRDDIHELLDHIGDRSESAATKAHKWLRKFFNYAVDKRSRHIKASPMHAMSSPYADGQRTRVLSDPEIKVVWAASASLPPPFRDMVRLLLLTGQRLREVAQMVWAEVDLAKGEWVIPSARTKNKHPHLVPLSAETIAILMAIAPKEKDRKGFVLTSDGKTAIGGFSKAKTALDEATSAILVKQQHAAGLPAAAEPPNLDHWVYHDLRRTLATGCQSKGVPLAHTEAILNHRSGSRGGITAIYQLYEYRTEKQAALNLWGEHVKGLMGQGPAA